jgi:hypothetical protein
MTTGYIDRGDEAFTLNGVTYDFIFPRSPSGLGFASASPFAPKSVTGERTYQDYDPLSAVAFSDLSGGMGQEYATDVTKYSTAYKIDARGGRIVLGPQAHIQTDYSCLTTQDETNLQAWLAAAYGNTVSPTATPEIDVNNYAAIFGFICPDDTVQMERIWLPLAATFDLGTINVTLFGPTYNILQTTTIPQADLRPQLTWVAAKFATMQALTPGVQYWVQVSLATVTGGTLTIWCGSDATQVVNTYLWQGGAWVNHHYRTPVLLVDPDLAPAGPPKYVMGAGADGVTRLWCYYGRRVYYINSLSLPIVTPDSTPAPHALGADVLDAVWWQASGDTAPWLWLALGDSTDMARYDGNVGHEDAASWADIAGKKALRFCAQDSVLYRAYDTNHIDGTLDGTFTSTASHVGGSEYPILNMCVWDGNIWVGKADGLYKVTPDAGYPTSGDCLVTRVIDFSAMADSNNFSMLLVHQGDLVFNVGQGIMKYTSGEVLTAITPETGLNTPTSNRSIYRAGCSTVNALYVVAEAPLDVGPATLYVYVAGNWHPITNSARGGDLARSVIVEPGFYGALPRVWWSRMHQVTYHQMPTMTQKRWLVNGVDWASTGYIILPWVDGNIRTINKDWIQVQVAARNVSATGPYIKVFWRPDEATAWVQLGINVTTTGITLLSFPAQSYGSKAQIKVELWSGTLNGTTVSPEVEAVVVKYLERPADSQSFTRMYELSTHALWRNGLPNTLNLAQQVTQLSTLRNSAEPLTWYPWFGGNYQVHIVNYSATELHEAEVSGADTGTIVVMVQLQVI